MTAVSRTLVRYSVALDAQLDMLREVSDPNYHKSRALSGADAEFVRLNLKTATPVYVAAWICKMLHGADGSLDENLTLAPIDLPALSGFVYLTELWPIGEGGKMATRKFSWFATGQQVTFFVYIQLADGGDGPSVARGMTWHYGEAINATEHLNGDAEHARPYFDSRRMIYALLSFMQQRLVSIRRERPDRAARKRAERDPRYAVAPVIQVIELRAREARHTSDAEGGRHLETRHVRRGHWRNQWYPSEDRHKALWIHPTVVGPDGAPLIDATKLIAVAH